MQIKPSAAIRQNYHEASALCKRTGEPGYLTKNGEGDLVVMDMEAFLQREKMLRLREQLIRVGEERLAGQADSTPDELSAYLDSVLESAKWHDEV